MNETPYSEEFHLPEGLRSQVGGCANVALVACARQAGSDRHVLDGIVVLLCVGAQCEQTAWLTHNNIIIIIRLFGL